MIHFVGAGPGAVDLITVRGQRYLKEADVIIYAGSLVNKGLLEYAKEGCEVYNSAYMTLEEVIEVMIKSEKEDKMTVRLHTGDPCLYGAIREQMDILDEKGIGDSFVKEANAKVLGYSQFSQDPQFDNSELKANPDGLYYKVFGTLSSGDITPEEGAKTLCEGITEILEQ